VNPLVYRNPHLLPYDEGASRDQDRTLTARGVHPTGLVWPYSDAPGPSTC